MNTELPCDVVDTGHAKSIFFFNYDETHTKLLKDAEPKFGNLIDSIGHIYRQVYPDPFHGLVHCILGQQVSAAAHATLWQRFLDRYGLPAPDTIAGENPDTLRNIGISLRKAGYITNIAQEFATGSLCGASLQTMESAALAKRLLKIPGIGCWTVEMLEIFTFQRMNVFSPSDLAIRKGLQKLYETKKISTSRFMEYARRFSPVGSVASLYLWELAKRKESLPRPGNPLAPAPGRRNTAPFSIRNFGMDLKILSEISAIVAEALNQNNLTDIGTRLNNAIPVDLTMAKRAAALREAHIYSLVCEQPGYAPDGRPGYLAADTDLKKAVLDEIGAMIEADFDKSEHKTAWQNIKASVEATPEKDFMPGVAVNCPDDYLLTLDRISCADILQQKNALPAWAEPYQA